jgi:hypothetical protein
MRPALVIPYHDPHGILLPHLAAILPDLKAHFERADVCLPPATRAQAGTLRFLESDGFFTILPWAVDGPIGDFFAGLYRHAARTAPPDQVLHLCFFDRLSFALQGQDREAFLADVDGLGAADLPLIFQRSPAAWATHPRNYHEIEAFVTSVGRLLFGRELDYAWCHLVLTAAQLGAILPRVRNHDLSMVAELVLQLQPDIRTRDVDWLAWEDPWILGTPAEALKRAREASPEETQKRLAYTLPMVAALVRFALEQKGQR